MLFGLLIQKLLSNLHTILSNATVSSYGLGRRRHNRELVDKTSRIDQASFIVRTHYTDIYLVLLLPLTCFGRY